MKHTNFDPIFEKLRQIENDELKKAVNSHGGVYRFTDDSGPCVTFPCSDSSDTAEDIRIMQVSVDDAGKIHLLGVPYGPFCADEPENEYDPDYLPLGEVGFIIDAIPGTETTKDVSQDIFIDVVTAKPTHVRKVRKDACDRIKAVMEKHDTDFILACDIDEGSSPVIEQHPFDDNNTRTLDSISLKDGKLTFSASNCSDSIDYDEDSINTDALLSVAEWLEENEDQLEENNDE